MSNRSSAVPSLSILLVEDHEDTARVMRLLLTRDGHRVDLARTLEEAANLCSGSSYDLLISDIQLPDGMAWDLLESGEACSDLKGIVVSGHGLAEHLRKSSEAGFKEHLVKPFRIDQLRSAIARVMSNGDDDAGPRSKNDPNSPSSDDPYSSQSDTLGGSRS